MGCAWAAQHGDLSSENARSFEFGRHARTRSSSSDCSRANLCCRDGTNQSSGVYGRRLKRRARMPVRASAARSQALPEHRILEPNRAGGNLLRPFEVRCQNTQFDLQHKPVNLSPSQSERESA